MYSQVTCAWARALV